jgi:hypothetical protein
MLAELLGHKPSCSEMMFIHNFTAACLWRHVLEPVNDSQVLGFNIISQVRQATEGFRLKGSLGSQIFKRLGGSVNFKSPVVDLNKLLDESLDLNGSVGFV